MKLGLQLYSVWDKMHDPDSMAHVLETVAAAGYNGVEFLTAGAYGEMPAEKLRALMEELSMRAIGVHIHIPFENWFTEALDETLQYAKDVGVQYAIMPYIAPDLQGEDTYRRIIQEVPTLIERCKKFGLTFAYHNHNFEFEKMGNGFVLDAIAGAAPDMGMELDTFWCRFAGNDPVAYMEKLGDKLKLIHIKDYNELAPFAEMKFTAIGTGVMDNASIIRKAEELGKEWVIVEQDNSSIDSLESAKRSAKAARMLMRECSR